MMQITPGQKPHHICHVAQACCALAVYEGLAHTVLDRATRARKSIISYTDTMYVIEELLLLIKYHNLALRTRAVKSRVVVSV